MSDFNFKMTMFGIASIFSTIVGVPGNLIAFIHFVKDKDKISSFLYRCISASDFVTCLLMVPKIATSFNPNDAWIFENQFICESWNMLWKVSYKFSLFSVLVLSMLRSYCLLFPFKRVRNTLVKLLIGSYLLLLILEESLLKVFLNFVCHYDPKFGHCLWLLQLPNRDDMSTMINPYSDKFKVLVSVYWDLQVSFPMFLVILSCLVTLIHMVITSQSREEESDQVRSRATGTILIVTLSCIFFNLAHCVIRSLDTISIISEYQFQWHTNMSPSTISFIYSFLDAPAYALSAAVNPLIYLWRMRDLRKWVGGAVERVCRARSKNSDPDKRYLKIGKHDRTAKSSKV